MGPGDNWIRERECARPGAWAAVGVRASCVRPHSKRTFTLADGSEVTRKIGDVSFWLNGRQGAAPVIFGEKQDSTLLGAVSLEALGMMLDPEN